MYTRHMLNCCSRVFAVVADEIGEIIPVVQLEIMEMCVVSACHRGAAVPRGCM